MKEANELHPERAAKEFGDKILKLIMEYGPHIGGPDIVGLLVSMATMTALSAGAKPDEAFELMVRAFNLNKEQYERFKS